MSVRPVLLEEARESRRLLAVWDQADRRDKGPGKDPPQFVTVGKWVGMFSLLVISVGLTRADETLSRLNEPPEELVEASRKVARDCTNLSLLVILIFTGMQSLRLDLTGFIALRMPSRRGLLVARWLAMWPWLLCSGLALVYVNLRIGWLSRAVSWADLITLIPGLLITPALVAGVLYLVWLLGLQPSIRWLAIPFLLLGPLALLYVGPLYVPPLWSLSALVMCVLVFVAQVWVVEQIELWAQVHPYQWLERFHPLQMLRSTRVVIASLLVPATVWPLGWMRGRHGLGWAAAYHDFGRGFALVKVLGGQLVALALLGLMMWGMYFLVEERSPDLSQALLKTWKIVVNQGEKNGFVWILLFGFIMLTLASIVRFQPLRLRNLRRLHLLGVDYRTILVFNVVTCWVSPALLIALMAALVLPAGTSLLVPVALAGICLLVRAGLPDEAFQGLESSESKPGVPGVRAFLAGLVALSAILLCMAFVIFAIGFLLPLHLFMPLSWIWLEVGCVAALVLWRMVSALRTEDEATLREYYRN